MPRILKNTRIKWLTPKMQLRERDGEQTHSSSSSLYDDLKTINFQSYTTGSGGGIEMPSGLPVGNEALDNDELTTDIIVTGVARKGVGDSFVSFSHGEPFRPFRDNGNPAVDGLATGNEFYATGSKISDVGEGFDQPLWSKSKFEVDLTPSGTHSFYIENYTSSSNNYPMAYWNTARKVWEGIGAGKEFGRYATATGSAFADLCEDQCIGFGNGINQGGSGINDFSAGAKVSNFSFPFHVKYHATSSNTIAMSDYIKTPFLLEKVVLEWSGSMAFNNTAFGSNTSLTMCTFFILNQRKPFAYNDAGYQRFVCGTADGHTQYLTVSAALPSSYNSGPVYNTVRDLVTYAQVVGFAGSADYSTIERAKREMVVEAGALTGFHGAWSGRMIMSATVKSALPNDGLNEVQIGHNDFGLGAMMLINKNSTRSGLFTPNGRDFVGSFAKGKVLESNDTLISTFTSSLDPTGSVVTLDRYSKPNPYLLQPSDQLVFGWQVPVANRINSAFGVPQYNGKGTEMAFAPVPSKITFYGSLIREGKEFHDTLDQLLTSMAVHEDIE